MKYFLVLWVFCAWPLFAQEDSFDPELFLDGHLLADVYHIAPPQIGSAKADLSDIPMSNDIAWLEDIAATNDTNYNDEGGCTFVVETNETKAKKRLPTKDELRHCPPKPTSNVTIRVNLSPLARKPEVAFSHQARDSYNHISTARIFDKLGIPHQMDVFFFKVDHYKWHYKIMIDKVLHPTNGEGLVSFDTDGNINKNNSVFIAHHASKDKTQLEFNLDFTSSTLHAIDGKDISKTYSVTQDGYSAGVFRRIREINGQYFAEYSNGVRKSIPAPKRQK